MQFPSGQRMKALSRDLRYLRSIPRGGTRVGGAELLARAGLDMSSPEERPRISTLCARPRGAYPVVTLADARVNALAVAQGQDPRQAVTSVPTLREAADKVIALHAANWKQRQVGR